MSSINGNTNHYGDFNHDSNFHDKTSFWRDRVRIFGGVWSRIGLQNATERGLVQGKCFRVPTAPPPPPGGFVLNEGELVLLSTFAD